MRINELMSVNCLEECLAISKHCLSTCYIKMKTKEKISVVSDYINVYI